MSSSCSTRASDRTYGQRRDMNICPFCEAATANMRGKEIPDTPENYEAVKRCQRRGWQVQRGEGTILAIVCKNCSAKMKLEEDFKEGKIPPDLQLAIEASMKTTNKEDDNDEDLQRALALSRQLAYHESGGASSCTSTYDDEHLEPPPPEAFPWQDGM